MFPIDVTGRMKSEAVAHIERELEAWGISDLTNLAYPTGIRVPKDKSDPGDQIFSDRWFEKHQSRVPFRYLTTEVNWDSAYERACASFLEEGHILSSFIEGETVHVPLTLQDGGNIPTADFLIIERKNNQERKVLLDCHIDHEGRFGERKRGDYRNRSQKRTADELLNNPKFSEDERQYLSRAFSALRRSNYRERRWAILNSEASLKDCEMVVCCRPREFFERVMVRFLRERTPRREHFLAEFKERWRNTGSMSSPALRSDKSPLDELKMPAAEGMKNTKPKKASAKRVKKRSPAKRERRGLKEEVTPRFSQAAFKNVCMQFLREFNISQRGFDREQKRITIATDQHGRKLQSDLTVLEQKYKQRKIVHLIGHVPQDISGRRGKADFPSQRDREQYQSIMSRSFIAPKEARLIRLATEALRNEHFHDAVRDVFDENPELSNQEVIVYSTPDEFMQRVLKRFMAAKAPDREHFIKEFELRCEDFENRRAARRAQDKQRNENRKKRALERAMLEERLKD